LLLDQTLVCLQTGAVESPFGLDGFQPAAFFRRQPLLAEHLAAKPEDANPVGNDQALPELVWRRQRSQHVTQQTVAKTGGYRLPRRLQTSG
jgi:hypothetical protein